MRLPKFRLLIPVIALPFFWSAAAQAQIVYSNSPSGDSFTSAGATNTGQAVGSTGWYYNNVRNSGVVGINTTYARNGNGSAYLETVYGPSGNSSKADIEFYLSATANAAGNYGPTSALGTLGNLTSLSYDWYRASGGTASTWLHPVIRLSVVSSDLTKSGYLIFEREINRDVFGNPVVAPTDQWISDDVFVGDYRLWSSGNTLPFNLNGTNGPAKYYDALTLSDWMTGYGTYYVTGISLGVGSGWGTFEGAVDNVSFAFTGGVSGSYNFEAVPEPSTYAAMLGLAALGFVAFRRFRRP
jgi:hypothetical protein